MTDRELLEAAAKAAGYDHLVWTAGASPIIPGALRPPNSKCYWNPLTDDGDAFRLAAKLKLRVDFYDDVVEALDGCETFTISGEAFTNTFCRIEDVQPDGVMAAARRAIVRAAAELGRSEAGGTTGG